MKMYRIKGYEAVYSISRCGRLWSFRKGIFLRQYIHKQGYLYVALVSSSGKKKTCFVHRLLALQFILNPEEKPQVNHINGIKNDNSLQNLEWCTMSENNQHAYDTGLMSRKGTNSNNILTEEQVIEIRGKYIPRIYTYDALGQEYGVSLGTIYDVVARRSWTHI